MQNKEAGSLSSAIVNNETSSIYQPPEYDSNNFIAYTESKADELEKQYNINSQAQSLIGDDKYREPSSLSSVHKWHILLNCIVCLSVLSLIVGWFFGWNVYQWIVGISASIIFLIGGFYISGLIELKTYHSANSIECIEFCILVVVNYVLYFNIKEEYVIVGYCVSSAALIFGIIATVKAHHHDEDELMVLDILACIFTLLLIVIMKVGWEVFIEWALIIIILIVVVVLIINALTKW